MFSYLLIFKAFLVKDFLDAISYKLQFVSTIFSILVGTFVFFTFSKLFNGTNSQLLEDYNNNYFAFSLIGLALTDFCFLLAKSIGQEIRNGQLNGTFEELISSSDKYTLVLTSVIAYPLVYGIIRMFVFFTFAIILFDLKITLLVNPIHLFFILFLTTICYLGVSLISASYTIIFKRGDPVNSIFFGVSAIFGGIIYPINALPEWTLIFSNILPITHILESIRACLILENNIALDWHLLLLTTISFFILVVGYVLCFYSLKESKKKGSLMYY